MSDQAEPVCPRLRPVDVRPIEHEGRPYYLLRDPQRLSDRVLLAPPLLVALLAFCDGGHTPAQMADAFAAYYGFPLGVEQVEELLAALDEALLLDNGRAAAAYQAALNDYRAAPYRPPIGAGQSYPAEPAALHSLLQDYLEAADTVDPAGEEWPQRVGLLSPHIDYARGGPVYAQVWKRAAAAVRQADIAILIGTDHVGDDPVTLTRQSYATPYGVLSTDAGLVDALAELLGEEAAFAGELRHRDEHSLELVAVWLHHLRQGKPCAVVPILVGSPDPLLVNGDGITPLFEQLLSKLETLNAGKRVVVIASGDLAHVGPAFDGPPLDEAGRAELHAADTELLRHMAAGDHAAFYAAIQRTANRTNVCGVAPIYWMMRLLENGHGRPISGEQTGYAVCPADNENRSAVTIGGMIFR